MENLKGFTYPAAAKCEEITIFDQKHHIQFLFKHLLIPFRLLWMHFDHDKDKIQIFNFWSFP